MTKEERYGHANPFNVDKPSEFVDVPAGPGLVRDSSGKALFGKGNAHAMKGHMSRWKSQAEFRKAINEAVSLEDIQEIAQAVVKEAKQGNLEAARLIMDRVAGKPTDRIEIEGTDGSQWAFVFKAKDAAPIIDATPIESTSLPPATDEG